MLWRQEVHSELQRWNTLMKGTSIVCWAMVFQMRRLEPLTAERSYSDELFFKHSLLETVTYRALPWPSMDFSALPESLCISYYEVPISDAGFGLSLYHLTFAFVSLSAFFYCSCKGRLHTQTVSHTYPGWIQLKETLLQKKNKPVPATSIQEETPSVTAPLVLH